MKKERIQWVPKLVDIKNIMPTPVNYKIRNALGAERLKESLAEFGLAGTVVCNWGKKFGDLSKVTLIDGNSRVEEEKTAGTKKLWVSLPHRAFTVAEFVKMTKVYDAAKAGDVDYDRIAGDKGSSEDFLKKYNIEIPFEKLGNKAPIKPLEYKAPEEAPTKVTDIKMVQLFFSSKQEAEFRELEKNFMKKFKTKNTTDTTLTVFKKLAKL